MDGEARPGAAIQLELSMTTAEIIPWLEAAIAHERAVAASWSLAGWPADANHYRRNAAKALRILRRLKTSS